MIAFQNAAPNRVCGFAANGPANGPEGPKNVSKRTGGVCARSLRLRPSGGERSRSVGQHGVHHGRLRCEQRWTSAASAGSGSAQPCCLYVALLGLCVVFLCLYFVLSRLSRIGSGCRKHVVCILSSCVLLVRAACSCACVCEGLQALRAECVLRERCSCLCACSCPVFCCQGWLRCHWAWSRWLAEHARHDEAGVFSGAAVAAGVLDVSRGSRLRCWCSPGPAVSGIAGVGASTRQLMLIDALGAC